MIDVNFCRRSPSHIKATLVRGLVALDGMDFSQRTARVKLPFADGQDTKGSTAECTRCADTLVQNRLSGSAVGSRGSPAIPLHR